ncbi:hypothetical protein ACMFMG_000547 [Clarireedia jacksonii]
MSVRRTRSVSKWKEVLGFDEGCYPTSETPPPYHRYESPESIYESVGSISPTVSYYHETLEELTPKFRYSDAPEALNPTPLYDDTPEAIPVETPLDYTYSDAPEAVLPTPVDVKTPVSAITSRFNTSYPPTPTTANTSSNTSLNYTPINPGKAGSRFPRDITFTRNSIYDILLLPTSPASSKVDSRPLPTPPPLFYITIHQSTPTNAPSSSPPTNSPSKPDIALHSTASPNSPLLAFASFNTVTLITDITTLPPPTRPLSPPTPPSSSSSLPAKAIVPPPTTYNLPTSPGDSLTFGVRSQGYKTERLVPTGGIFTSERYAFYHTLPRTFVKEKFEWRQVSSSSQNVPSVGLETVPEEMTTKKGGVKMKLVRCSTGETVAVYVGVGNEDWADKDRRRRPKREKGKVLGLMRWVELEGGSLGEEFELMGVMSVLGVMERWRRVLNTQKQLVERHWGR